MEMVVLSIQDKLKAAVGAMKDHASIGKAMIYMKNHDFSHIEIAVVRATAHDNAPIDDQQMHQILFLASNTPAESIPFLAERISRRLVKTRDPFVALKTLLLIHRLLRGGNCYFEQQLRSAHTSGHLQITTTNFHSSASFLHKYAAYLQERIGWVINQSGKLEPVNLQLRSYDEKSIDMIFRRLPKCQAFIDKVLDCWPISDDIILLAQTQAAMTNTLKESFRVYMTFCEGIAALVNMFFDLTRPARELACQILKRASQQSQQLYHLYENCKQVIENRNLEYPLVQIITMDHVMALEQCSTLNTHHPAPIFDCLANFTGKQENGRNLSLSSTVFSSKLETKINKVWVLFEDEDHSENLCVNIGGS